ncbi:MAG: rhodanese-like domain-containing protein [Acidobacteria bacterium]|nr:rhodanese-like domain-containing protein [Acidobacteriota bacterium]
MESVRIERFYLGCLAHASYAVISEGVAAIIDPQRDVDLYVDAAQAGGFRIEHIIETHLHADFVSGHHELAERTGAKIYLGAGSGATFPHTAVRDGDEIQFGQCRLSFLETPGHTLEGVCVILHDLSQPGGPSAVFTGDTLFVGDVGRPDLSPTHTPQQLAAILYSSLHDKLLKLPDETVIYPAHGAGSLCGRQMSAESSSTIDRQKRTNYALLARSQDEFVKLLTDNMPDRPEYFAREVDLNRRGAAAIGALPVLAELSAPDVQRLQAEGAVVVDTRPAMEFAVAHVPGSVHIALTGQYASWAARVLGLDTRLIIVSEDAEQVRESQIRLARVGIENLAGYLGGGVAGWIRAGMKLEYIPQVTVPDFLELRHQDPAHLTIVDVREPNEVSSGAIPGSINIPLGHLADRAQSLPHDHLIVVHCKGGYRSSIATSLLRRAGFEDIANLTGGYDAWKALQPGGATPVCEGAG